MPTGWLPEEVHVCRECGLPTEENAMWQHCECPTEEEESDMDQARQERPFRNAHWTGDLAASGTRVHTRHYATREQAITDADTMAAAGESVHLEEWDAATAADPVNQGWGLYDRREPHVPVTSQDVTGTLPGLTPYDTGDRLEPHRWRERPDQPDDYGKVDFDDDTSETVATVHIEKTPAGKYRLVIETDFEFESVSFNGESTLMQEEQS